MSKPVPPHGTYARANGSWGYRPPCTCDQCLPVRRRVKKTNEVYRRLGRPGYVDATPARERLQHLRKTAGWVSIAEAAGLYPRTLRNIASGHSKQVLRSTHQRIMAARVELSSHDTVSAVPTRRRIRALQARGHSLEAIAKAANSEYSRTQAICNTDQPTVRKHLADRITTAYEQLAATTGTSQRAINRAKREGWPDPLWWEDMGGIDDPDAPDDEKHLRPEPRFRALASEGLWLERQGYTREQAAERLGVTRANLQASISRARKQGHLELGEAA